MDLGPVVVISEQRFLVHCCKLFVIGTSALEVHKDVLTHFCFSVIDSHEDRDFCENRWWESEGVANGGKRPAVVINGSNDMHNINARNVVM